MYDELVERLRASVDGRYEKCEVCPYEEDYPCCVDCLDKMHKQAADAIEELSRDLDSMNEANIALYGASPKWIPVTERLPEDIDEEVLVCTEDYGVSGLGFVTVATYGANGWLECWERKTYLTAVTHWMPLPEPPKKE